MMNKKMTDEQDLLHDYIKQITSYGRFNYLYIDAHLFKTKYDDFILTEEYYEKLNQFFKESPFKGKISFGFSYFNPHHFLDFLRTSKEMKKEEIDSSEKLALFILKNIEKHKEYGVNSNAN